MNEKTRVSLNIATLVTLLVFVSSGVWAFSTIKSDIDVRITKLEKADEQHCNDYDDIIQEQSEIKIEQEKARERDTVTQTDLAEIKTDLKWIRAYMEREK